MIMTAPTITTVDVDADLAAAEQAGTADRRSHTNPDRRLWAALGLELEHVQCSDATSTWTREGSDPASGLYRRLAATLRSISERRDGNTWWAAGPAEPAEGWPRHPAGAYADFRLEPRGSFRLRWWSDGGCSSGRRWHMDARVTVATDDWLATFPRVADATLTVVSDTSRSPYPAPERDGEVTVYQAAHGLSVVLARPVAELLGRDALRVMAGARSVRQPWDQAPDADWWLTHPA